MEEKKIKGKQKVKNVKKKEPNKMKNEQNNKLVEENAKLNEKLLRVMAEMQNMKRRNEEEGKEKVLLWNIFEIIFLIFVLKELDSY